MLRAKDGEREARNIGSSQSFDDTSDDVARRVAAIPLTWEQVLEMQSDAVVLVDPNGIVRFASAHVVELSGYHPSELVGHSVEQFVPERHSSAHLGHRPSFIARATRREMNDVSDLYLRRRDGSELAVTIALSPLSVADETWTAAFLRDDSQHRRAELEQRQNDLRFRMAFDNNVTPMVFTNLAHEAIAINNAFCQMTGYEREELLGKDSSAITHPCDATVSSDHALETANDSATNYHKRYVHKDGRVIIVDIARSLARDTVGNHLYFVVSLNDITERVRRNDLLRLHGDVNRVAVGATSEDELYQRLCDTLVNAGYTRAWFTQVEGVGVRCSATGPAHVDTPLHEAIAFEVARDVVVSAARSATTQVVNDLGDRDVDDTSAASRVLNGSLIALPEQSDRPRHVLVVEHPDRFAFDDVTVAGLEDIVREVDLAMRRIRAANITEKSLAAMTFARDELAESQRALQSSEQRFRLAFEHNMAPMIFSDYDDVAFAANDAFCAMVGFTREQLVGGDSTQFTLPDDIGISEGIHQRFLSEEIDRARYVKRYLRKDGSVVVAEVSKTVARDTSGTTMYFLTSERDITAERALNDQLMHQALHDPLTGLANRLLFEDRLSQAQARIARHGGVSALMLLDLDDFKGVNDTHGHLIGDQLLIQIARRFEQVSRTSDTLCRFGGDEFLLLVEGLGDPAEAEETARRLLEVFDEPFLFGTLRFRQSATIGVVAWDAQHPDTAELLRFADVALHEAKNDHKGGYALFVPRMVEQAISRFTLAQELRQALHDGGLAMHYQPIVDLRTSQVVGFEALMRWHHAERGMVAPDVFIAVAEQSHLIIELGAFAMSEALAAARQWQPTSPGALAPYVTVNLSAHQFHDPDLVSMVERCLHESGLEPSRLIVEVTEGSALVNIAETLDVLEHLRQMGIGVALDDFGTGYSSLSYLTLLEPTIIKIDRSFVSPTLESAPSDTLLEAIISLGAKLDFTLLAEGIETPAQLAKLRSLHCQLGQGYLFSPAVPLAETSALASRRFGLDDR